MKDPWNQNSGEISTNWSHESPVYSIVHGIHDKVIPFSHAQEMNEKIEDSQLVPFHFSGHGAVWEERDKFNQLLTQFIG